MLTRRMTYCADHGALTARRPESACGTCRFSGGCGSSLLERYYRHDIQLPLSDACQTEPPAGAEFTVRLPAATFLGLCVVVFPGLAFLLLGGGWLGALLFPAAGEGAAVAGSAAGLIVGALLLRLYDSRFGSRGPGRRLIVEPSGRVSESDS